MHVSSALPLSGLFLALALPGCSGDAREVTLSDIRARIGEHEIRLRVEHETFIAECMADAGLAYTPAESGPIAVEHYGYTSALQASASRPIAPETTTGKAVPDDEAAYNAVLNGTDTNGGGCRGLADQVLDGVVIQEGAIQQLERAILQLQGTGDYSRAVDQWRACMADDYPNDEFVTPELIEALLDHRLVDLLSAAGVQPTDDLTDDLLELGPTAAQPIIAELASTEAALFEADARCQDTSGLRGLYADIASLAIDVLPENYLDAPVTSAS